MDEWLCVIERRSVCVRVCFCVCEREREREVEVEVELIGSVIGVELAA